MEMQHVSGRLRFVPREVNEVWVSPRPWRRMRMLIGLPVEGGTMSSVMFGGKSDLVGRRGDAILDL